MKVLRVREYPEHGYQGEIHPVQGLRLVFKKKPDFPAFFPRLYLLSGAIRAEREGRE